MASGKASQTWEIILGWDLWKRAIEMNNLVVDILVVELVEHFEVSFITLTLFTILTAKGSIYLKF